MTPLKRHCSSTGTATLCKAAMYKSATRSHRWRPLRSLPTVCLFSSTPIPLIDANFQFLSQVPRIPDNTGRPITHTKSCRAKSQNGPSAIWFSRFSLRGKRGFRWLHTQEGLGNVCRIHLIFCTIAISVTDLHTFSHPLRIFVQECQIAVRATGTNTTLQLS